MESIRSCLVCRKKALKFELCRFVRAVDGELCFDEKAKAASRGAYVCADKTCIVKAFDRRMVFRGEVNLPIAGKKMLDQVYGQLKKASLSRLGLLRKQGQLEVGHDAVLRLLNEGKLEAVIFAKDLSERTIRSVKSSPQSEEKYHQSPFLKDEIGYSLGRDKTGVVGLLKSRISEEALFQLKKLSKLEP